MAKDKNDVNTKDLAGDDKSTNAALTLYKVSFTYIHTNGQLRTSAIVIGAESPQHAKIKAGTHLETSSFSHPRITKITVY